MPNLTLDTLKTAYRSDFYRQADQWAQDAIEKGLYTLLAGDPIPAYAAKQVADAVRNVNGVNNRMSRDLMVERPRWSKPTPISVLAR